MRTIEDRADEIPGETLLLPNVQAVWDLGSIKMVGPGFLLRVGHSLDVYEGRFRAEGDGKDPGRGDFSVLCERGRCVL